MSRGRRTKEAKTAAEKRDAFPQSKDNLKGQKNQKRPRSPPSRSSPPPRSPTPPPAQQTTVLDLPQEVVGMVLQFLPKRDLLTIVATHSYFEVEARRLIWGHATLDLGKHLFQPYELPKWSREDLWADTKSMRFVVPWPEWNQTAYQKIIKSVRSYNKIKLVSYSYSSGLTYASLYYTRLFLQSQSSLEKVVIPKLILLDSHQKMIPRFHRWACRLQVQRPHQPKSLDVVVLENSRAHLEIVKQLLHREATITSVAIWGYVNETSNEHPASPFWDQINSVQVNALKNVTEIYLADLRFKTTLYDISGSFQQHTDLFQVKKLHIHDCPNAETILEALAPSLTNLTSFGFGTEQKLIADFDCIQDFLRAISGLEELSIRLWVPENETKYLHWLLINHSTVKKLAVWLSHTAHEEPLVSDIVTMCPKLTHLSVHEKLAPQYDKENDHPYRLGRFTEEWRAYHRAQAVNLRKSTTLANINIVMPAPSRDAPLQTLPTPNTSRYQSVLEELQTIYAAEKFYPETISMSFNKSWEHSPRVGDKVGLAPVPTTRPFKITRKGQAFEAKPIDGDWTTFGIDRRVKDVAEREMGTFPGQSPDYEFAV
ncbi:hypothetical protein K505DRAFT_419873 [Melanomma pulvis-pyrius CBS 109.77]|uniref:F-box domain-containing protein n=1 Tax=Melanomma pulvis-pyrius CBS 109.77 TaxID=1314802 RepID=A0A6A6X2N2_9PLEO|nr:hypothetical protein K505DRAFT_419873 [Melanomma pulvis-pyrius CBS 109.77]